MNKNILTIICLTHAFAVQAQLQPAKQTPESSELWDPVPRMVKPGNIAPTVSEFNAPSDAIVLFDGKNLDSWVSTKNEADAAPWSVAGGILTVLPKSGDIQTKQHFENFQLHIEWRTPAIVEGNNQEWGNSGVFMQGKYELQIMDNSTHKTYSNGQAGAVYKQTMPLVNASVGPGEWQTYDIIYSAPHFNKDGQMTIPPYITVLHNGVLIQNRTAIQGTTPYVGRPAITPHGPGPIRLQDYNNTTSFRNIWIREL